MKNEFSHRGIASWMIVLVCLFLFVSSGWASCNNIPVNYGYIVDKTNRCIREGGSSCPNKCNEASCAELTISPTIVKSGSNYYTNFRVVNSSLNSCSYKNLDGPGCGDYYGNSVRYEGLTRCDSQEEAQDELCKNNPSASGCKTPAEICLEKQSECEQLGGTFNGDVAESNECVFLCEIKLQNKQTAIKYTNENKYYVIDNSVASSPSEIEISQSIFNDLKDINSTCKESLFRGILNGSYIYWHSNQDTPANVNHIIKLR